MEFLQNSSSSFFLMEMIDQNRLIFSSLKTKKGGKFEKLEKMFVGIKVDIATAIGQECFRLKIWRPPSPIINHGR